MIDVQAKFQCPACGSVVAPDTGACLGCGQRYATEDGILDFVGGRFATQLNVQSYDEHHGVGDDSVEAGYRHIKQIAGDRWPASLGSVVEIGCGTGAFSRAMLKNRETADAVLTDVSPDMLRLCRMHLERLGLSSAVPVRFATYSANETCFRDEAFDSCVGTSVMHHITDARAFLAEVWRMLRPGGRAFFTEPCFRYARAMAMAFADIIAFLLSRDPVYLADRQTLLNWVAETRRGTMLQGELALLARYEDKHLFVGEDLEAMALQAGFATAEALTPAGERDELGNVGALLGRIGIGEPVASQVMRLWPTYAAKYLALLHTRDAAAGYLLWLTKSTVPTRPAPSRSPMRPEPRLSSEADVTGGGMPLRWVLTVLAAPAPGGLRVKLEGWCLANANVKLLRMTIGGVSHATPVWLPRADVHLTLNADGRYAAWNSLCCGVDCDLMFDGVYSAGRQHDCRIDLIFSDDRYVPLFATTLPIGEPFSNAR